MGIAHAELGALAVHQLCEALHAASHVAGEGARHVVSAFHHQNLEQLATGVLLAWLEVEFGGFAERVVGGNGDGFVDVSSIKDAEGSDDLLGGGDGADAVCVLRVEVAATVEIDDEDAFRDDGRGRGFRNRADQHRRVGGGLGISRALRRVSPAGRDG